MKTVTAQRVESLAKQFNIPKITVEEIIKGYIKLCISCLRDNNEVEIQGLAIIKPEHQTSCTACTTAFMSRLLTKTYNFPQNTIYSIITGYIDAIKEDVFNGNVAEIRGLVSFHPKRKADGTLTVHSKMSIMFSQDNAVRVHTHKLFKYQLKNLSFTG